MHTLGRVGLATLILAATGPATAAAQQFFFEETDHYRVSSAVSAARADEIARRMESAFTLLNELYHFDESSLPTRMRVRIFAAKSSFDGYLDALLSEGREDFVYIHYSATDQSELVGYEQPVDAFDRSLLHLSAVQLLKTYIENPPVWLREGVAAYFENSRWDDEKGVYVFRPNLVWLPTLQAMLAGTSDIQELPTLTLARIGPDQPVSFLRALYPQAWGLVHYLSTSSDRAVNRILWDVIASLVADASLTANSDAALDQFAWRDPVQLRDNFIEYVGGLKTFADLIDEGITRYGRRELQAADDVFVEALILQQDNYVPHYYRGLISYAESDYVRAEQHYRAALALGDDTALVHYALGVNAFADRRLQQAAEHLNEAKLLDVITYADKSDSLLRRIDALE